MKLKIYLAILVSSFSLLPAALLAMNPTRNININRETEWQNIPKEVQILILSQVVTHPNLDNAFKELGKLRLISKEYSQAIPNSILKFTIQQLQQNFGYTPHYIYNWLNNRLKLAQARAKEQGKSFSTWINQSEIEEKLKKYPANEIIGQDLIEAIQDRDLSKVKKLVQKQNVDINSKDQKGYTVLMYAILGGNVHLPISTDFDIVKFLIDSGADVNIKTNTNDSALTLFAKFGIPSQKIAKLLIDANPDLNSKVISSQKALGLAVQRLDRNRPEFRAVAHHFNIVFLTESEIEKLKDVIALLKQAANK